MIAVTCRNGEHFSVDPDAIERVETDPDTVVHLVDGTKYVVVESFEHLLGAIRNHHALAVVAHEHLTDGLPPDPAPFRIERREFSRDGAASCPPPAAVPRDDDEV